MEQLGEMIGKGTTGKVRAFEKDAVKIFKASNIDKGRGEYELACKIFKALEALDDPGTMLFSIPKPISFEVHGNEGYFRMERIANLPAAAQASIQSVIGTVPAICQLFTGETQSLAYLKMERELFGGSAKFHSLSHTIIMANEIAASGLPLLEIIEGIADFLGFLHYTVGLDSTDVEFMVGGNQLQLENYVCIDFEKTRELSSDNSAKEIEKGFTYEQLRSFPWPGDTNWEVFEKAYLAQAARAGKLHIAREVISELASMSGRAEEDVEELFEEASESAIGLGFWGGLRCVGCAYLSSGSCDNIAVMLVGAVGPELGYVGRGMLWGVVKHPSKVQDVLCALEAAHCKRMIIFLGDCPSSFASEILEWAESNKIRLAFAPSNNVFLYKIAGASVMEGKKLHEVLDELDSANASMIHVDSVKDIPGDYDNSKIAMLVNGSERKAIAFATEIANHLECAGTSIAMSRHTFVKAEISAILFKLQGDAFTRLKTNTTAPFWLHLSQKGWNRYHAKALPRIGI